MAFEHPDRVAKTAVDAWLRMASPEGLAETAAIVAEHRARRDRYPAPPVANRVRAPACDEEAARV